ncbi:MAG TPA: GspH/FimT family pseudopilin [Longimicrobiales bacterium]|nr:GspH/FimT family pseudopilin [Longimicrobiales bacterium]
MRGGYTLTELMVVIAIMGLVAAGATPALGVWLDASPRPAEEVASLLRSARAEALRTGVPVMLTMDPTTGVWALESPDSVVKRGLLRVSSMAAAPGGERVIMRFGPSGGAVGGGIPVLERGRVVRVTADRWTGEVSFYAP